jgi:putative peptide zinc metalloprotease protein
MSRLLHLVASNLDGVRTPEQVAEAVGAEYGRELSAEGLSFLLDERLGPLHLLADDTGQHATEPAPVADPVIALRLRRTLVSARRTRRIARVLAPAFHPFVVALVLVVLVAGDVWLVRTAAFGEAMAAVLATPVVLLGLLGVLLVSTLFHEFGHAAACHRGGATPGSIGVAVYVVYPAFFTDVTQSYRLGRGGRLRTDLGGVYFNAVTLVALIALYAGTGYAPLLLAVFVVHGEMLQQLLPLARLDG